MRKGKHIRVFQDPNHQVRNDTIIPPYQAPFRKVRGFFYCLESGTANFQGSILQRETADSEYEFVIQSINFHHF
jgi:hypothetical protein